MCKIRVRAISMGCPFNIHLVFGHHSSAVFLVGDVDQNSEGWILQERSCKVVRVAHWILKKTLYCSFMGILKDSIEGLNQIVI